MPHRQFRYCRERGCSERTNHPSGWCPNHQSSNSYLKARAEHDAQRKTDPIWKLYGAPWRRFKLAFQSWGNVICQRIENGDRCTRPMEILHHIISPRENPSLMYTPSNVVGVCRQHHPTTEGEPKENLLRLREIYVPTIWRALSFLGGNTSKES
jgi:hypothetical protein